MHVWALALAIVVAPVATTAPVFISTAAAQQTQGAPDQAMSRYEVWLHQLNRHAAVGASVNNSFAEQFQAMQAQAPREQRLATARITRMKAQASVDSLNAAIADLRALGRLEPGAASRDVVEVSATLYDNTLAYLEAMRTATLALVNLISAIEANDRAAIQRLTPELLNGLSLLVEGQRLQALSAQASYKPDSSGYHTMGAMAVLYAGLRANSFPNIANRSATLRRLAGEASGWAASGRRALSSERLGLGVYTPSDRAVMVRYLDLEAEVHPLIDQLAALLNEAASAAEQTDDFGTLNRRFAQRFSGLEIAIVNISQRQQALIAPAVR